MDKIKASSNIGKIFARWPHLVSIFIEYEMSCPGCYLASFESLGDALEIYKLPAKPFIINLNDEIENNSK